MSDASRLEPVHCHLLALIQESFPLSENSLKSERNSIHDSNMASDTEEQKKGTRSPFADTSSNHSASAGCDIAARTDFPRPGRVTSTTDLAPGFDHNQPTVECTPKATTNVASGGNIFLQSLRKMPSNLNCNSVEPEMVDARTLRMMAYNTWYRKNKKLTAESTKLGSHEESEVTKKQDDFEKLRANEKAFAAWKAKKRSSLLEQLRQRKEEEQAKKQTLEKEREQNESASKAFHAWKSMKDAALLKKQRDEQQAEQAMLEKKRQEANEKIVNSERAFMLWKAQKEAIQREIVQKRKQIQAEMKKKKEEEARIRLNEAAEAYYRWEMRKISSEENMDKVGQRQCPLDRVPWRPPSARPCIT
ncbi:unnamed protein product [Dicrocoelium dendriticum]|nr:unnamed protein product [Dicrocoelium dendriticum]